MKCSFYEFEVLIQASNSRTKSPGCSSVTLFRNVLLLDADGLSAPKNQL